MDRLENINDKLIDKSGLFLLPKWLWDNHQIKTDAYSMIYGENLDNLDRLEKNIYINIIDPDYRASQYINFSQLKIFQPFMTLIDHSILSFYQNNYICTYFTLTPIIEGLLRKWHKEASHYKNNFKEKDFANYIIRDIKRKYVLLNIKKSKKEKVIFHCNLLHKILNKVFFENDQQCNKKNITFNRHIVTHMLNNPDYFESKNNALKLLCLLDLIAECYKAYLNIEANDFFKKNTYSTIEYYEKILKRNIALYTLRKYYQNCKNKHLNLIGFETFKKQYVDNFLP